MKKQQVAVFSLFFLVFCSSIIQAFSQTPAASPKPAPKPAAPGPKATTPARKAPSPKPLVPTLPQSPDSSDSAPDDITKILRKAKTFNVLIRLLKTTEIMNNINSQLITSKTGGITILAPDDSAFSNLKAGFMNSLNEGQKIELVQFHILPEFVASNNFDSLSNPVQTVAGKDPERLPLNVNALGNSVNISTGVVNASVVGVVYSDNKLAIYHVDKVLLPLDFFQKAKAPALAPTALAKAPKGAKENTAAGDDQDDTATPDLKKSAAVVVGGKPLVSLAVAFLVAVPLMMWS
ncbi:hypothetical protein PIB30_012342 [Stylosanthes scabra]|uniref:FAS1 domain-containing protein n=1 Tax=Stylosanthes scabra TaxID=79078 RepID=A0ABU6Z543_9FABA|nr:hypothetical protein [Stylosanthes scabra]